MASSDTRTYREVLCLSTDRERERRGEGRGEGRGVCVRRLTCVRMSASSQCTFVRSEVRATLISISRFTSPVTFIFSNTSTHTLGRTTGARNRLKLHNQSSVWPNQSMMDYIIASWDAIFNISARGRRDEGVTSARTPLRI